MRIQAKGTPALDEFLLEEVPPIRPSEFVRAMDRYVPPHNGKTSTRYQMVYGLRGNAATLDSASIQRFAHETATYVAGVCERLELTPTRIAIDAPSAPRSPHITRRAAETALDEAGISCFATPSAQEFDVIRAKVAQHLSLGGEEDRTVAPRTTRFGFQEFDVQTRYRRSSSLPGAQPSAETLRHPLQHYSFVRRADRRRSSDGRGVGTLMRRMSARD